MVAPLERAARLFFALWPDKPMQAALSRAVSALEPLEARILPEGNLHLTVAFLGAVPHSRFEALFDVAAQSVSALAPGGVPIAVTLDALEYWRKPQLLVATSRDTPPAAVALAETLKRALVERSFSPDLKPFRVHATVARKVRRVSRELHIAPVRWTFDSLHLIESQTAPEGSVYSTVRKWVLDKRD